MKLLTALGASILLGFAAEAMSQCAPPNQLLTGDEIRVLLSGKRVFAIAPSSETWNEDHCPVAGAARSSLYKVGDGTPVDPRALKGSWRVLGTGNQNDSLVEYTYTGASADLVYQWQMRKTTGSSPTYYFCNGAVLVATLTSNAGSTGSCP